MIRNEGPRVESVHRALVLVKLLIERGSLGVTEAAAALEVNASTAQRLLATLTSDGFASQGRDRRYAPGPALYTPGLPARIPQLTDRLRPVLEELFARAGETVHLAALFGSRILHLDGIAARSHPLQLGLRTGVWLPAHATSGGKAILAELPAEELDAVYDGAPDVDPAALRHELVEVRATRIARNLGQSEPGIAAMSVSLGEVGGERVSVSIALPLARFTEERGAKWSRDLIEVADALAQGRL